ncbi:MAG: cobalamin biosynthesis protein CbiD [Lachnospiraceae bacterium]|nr:cobalamin biosynthesis protein CbiD [Lachnospiraceae bacterium]
MTAIKDGKRLRYGVTTGTCAAGAARACAAWLFNGKKCDRVRVHTPKGTDVWLTVNYACISKASAECYVIKDSGDDPDVTDGCKVYARVSLVDDSDIKEFDKRLFMDENTDEDGAAVSMYLAGGAGIGYVTKPGLEQEVGYPAINKVPRKMIFEAVRRELGKYTEAVRRDKRNILITISIPDGEELSKKTFNGGLGIEGGLSILGTSGILEPMSEKAIVDTIELNIKQKSVLGAETLILVPGNYGLSYMEEYLKLPLKDAVKVSNYIGEALDFGGFYGFKKILLIGNIGKLCKLAAGIMNTHSRVADGRREIFAYHAALIGGGRDTIGKIAECVNTEAMLDILEEENICGNVIESMCRAIDEHIKRRCNEGIIAGAMLFSEKYGYLGATKEAEEIYGSLCGGRPRSGGFNNR